MFAVGTLFHFTVVRLVCCHTTHFTVVAKAIAVFTVLAKLRRCFGLFAVGTLFCFTVVWLTTHFTTHVSPSSGTDGPGRAQRRKRRSEPRHGRDGPRVRGETQAGKVWGPFVPWSGALLRAAGSGERRAVRRTLCSGSLNHCAGPHGREGRGRGLLFGGRGGSTGV